MSTYCISDIHGHYNEFLMMLDKISFAEDGSDTLWVLGDLGDRGPDSFSMFDYAIECSEGKHGDIHFLMGNHEQMMKETVPANFDEFVIRFGNQWAINGGIDTAKQIYEGMPDGWIKDKLAPWLADLPLYAVIEVNGVQWMLVHAGFDPARYSSERKSITNPFSATIDVGYGFGVQYKDDLLWVRREWIMDPHDAPLPTVHGHTMTHTLPLWGVREMFEEKIGSEIYGEDGIVFYGNKIDIDCGAGVGYQLGCLRLDDCAEFYVNIEAGPYI